MTERRTTPIFHGINRPTEFAGLPVIMLLFGGALGAATAYFFGLIAAMIVSFIAYLALRLFYEWEPHFFRILWVVRTKTPRTRNRRRHGGDLYDV